MIGRSEVGRYVRLFSNKRYEKTSTIRFRQRLQPLPVGRVAGRVGPAASILWLADEFHRVNRRQQLVAVVSRQILHSVEPLEGILGVKLWIVGVAGDLFDLARVDMHAFERS